MQHLNYRVKQLGFSLLELLVVLVIMGFLSLLAYPSYQQHILKVKRSEAQQALWLLATKMEQYATSNQSYVGANFIKLGVSPQSVHGYYTLHIIMEKLSNSYYLLEAAPNFLDSACGTFSLDSLGERSTSGKDETCWG